VAVVRVSSGGGAQAARIELVINMLPVTEKISFKASHRRLSSAQEAGGEERG
jgi:hypothetical protein